MSPGYCHGCETLADHVIYGGSTAYCLTHVPMPSITRALGLPALAELLAYRVGDRVIAHVVGMSPSGPGTVIDARLHVHGVSGDRLSYLVGLDVPSEDPLVDGWFAPRDLKPVIAV
ncbi:hypothetical protein [Mycolicibacterium llatzerense]|uniref:hypothetical protein n=1 Tax=Mycolicibacterium llatzerense TaxID=280871 RepID=UPI0008DD9773|nr:hypothetical protein [Mycolicibacterium llatzerense]